MGPQHNPKTLTMGDVILISGDNSLVGDDGEDCLVGLFGGGDSPVVKTSHFFSDSLGLSLNTDCSSMMDVLPTSCNGSLVGDEGEDCLEGLFRGGDSRMVKTSHFFSDSLGLSLNTDCSPMEDVLPISCNGSLVGEEGEDCLVETTRSVGESSAILSLDDTSLPTGDFLLGVEKDITVTFTGDSSVGFDVTGRRESMVAIK